MWRASLICAHCGGGVLEAGKDSEENEKARGWEVDINICEYCISCVYRVLMN